MPELPEVENVRRGLKSLVQGKMIEEVTVLYAPMIDRSGSLKEWTDALKGEHFENFRRRGKFLVFDLTHWVLVSHLRMEGKYLYFPAKELPEAPDKHTHVIFQFTGGSQLHYHDVRKFGRMQLLAPEEEEAFFAKRLGPEPEENSFLLEDFYQRLQKTRRAVKTALLDQKLLVAGLGNIYVDEVLYRSKIHPLQPTNTLTKDQAERLRHHLMVVLDKATQLGGSTIRTYKNSLGESGRYQEYLEVYGKKGQPCPRCATPLEKIQVNGRGTHFCPHCQVLKEDP